MQINGNQLATIAQKLFDCNILNQLELQRAKAIADDSFAFNNQAALAESIHLHIHVQNINSLPAEVLKGGQVVNQSEGYIKYAFNGGINLIFSHIPVAQKEKTIVKRDDTYLDHIGIDIRSDDKAAYITFQQIPFLSAQNDYLFVRQGDGKEAVKCCHMQVKEKYWVYPDETLNYEFAFGPLIIHGTGFGVDLRPANPFVGKVEETTACCSPSPKTAEQGNCATAEVKAKPAIFIN